MIRLHRPVCPYPKPLDEKTNYKHPTNKAALAQAGFGKCMYCEVKILDTQYGDVEHIKPKDKFPELEFEWSNLGLSCAVCNNNKNNYYCEESRIIDPYVDEPSDFLYPGDALIFAKGWESVGGDTIDLIKLNRTPLVEKRAHRAQEVSNLVEKIRTRPSDNLRAAAIDLVLDETGPSTEFSFVSRATAERLLEQLKVEVDNTASALQKAEA